MTRHGHSGEVLELPNGSQESGMPRIVLTRPPVVVPKWGISAGLLVPPIGLAYLSASLREQGFPVSIVDPVGEAPSEVNPIPGRQLVTYGLSLDRIVAAIPADSRFIGLSCTFSHEWPVAKLLVKKIRRRFSKVVIIAGGEHITAAPEFSLRDCPDIQYAVLGEGEETLVELIKTIRQGGQISGVAGLMYLQNSQGVFTPARRRLRAFDALPRPAWDLVPIENYLRNGLSYGVTKGRTMPMMATRGCPYKCTFCSSPNMWTQRWFARAPQDVANEIEAYVRCYRANNFDFYDLTAIVRKDWIVQFCHELISRGLNISWQLPAGTRSEAIDEEVASLLARSGHRNLVYAPESGSERMLKMILKKVDLSRMCDSIRSAIRNGISVKLNIIVGFPKETAADIFQTYRFLVKCAWIGVDDATLATFCPYPGSELYTYLRETGRIKVMDDDYFYGLVSMGDIRHAISYSESICGPVLLAYKVFGIVLFYLFSYLFRPMRIFQTLWHLYLGDHQTRVEKALSHLHHKIRVFRRVSAAGQGEDPHSPASLTRR